MSKPVSGNQRLAKAALQKCQLQHSTRLKSSFESAVQNFLQIPKPKKVSLLSCFIGLVILLPGIATPNHLSLADLVHEEFV